MDVTSYSQLQKAIENAVSDSMEDMGKDMEDIVKEEINDEVYGSYTPIMYLRTGELLSSIESEVIGKNEVEIKHNTAKIHATSIKDGSDISNALPEIVHDGCAPNIFNEKHYVWENKRPYMDTTKKRLQSTNEHVDSMKKSLKKKGFDVD